MSAYSEHTFSFPKLNNENYKEWKYSIDLYLISQDLQNYTSDKIIDEEKSPSKTPDAEKEKLKEGKALAIICLSIREDLKSIVYEAHTPSEAWKLLKTVFEPVSRARVARLRRNFMNTRYTPDEPMSSYLNRITLAAKELEQAGKKVEDDEVAFQILENLPDSYESLVAQLYRLTDAEFTVKGIRSHLLAEYDRQRNRSLQISDNLPANQALVSTEDSRPKEYFNRDEGRRCYRCGLKGHLIKNCRVKPKSKKRYHQSSKGRQAHFAAAMMSEHTSLEFVLDSAATDHFSNNKKVFQNFRSLKTKAAIACGSTDILGIGDIQLVFNTGTVIKTLLLKDVFFAPKMTRNLISVRCLTSKDFKITFDSHNAYISKNSNDVFLCAPLCNKFYTLSANCKRIGVPEAQNVKSSNMMMWHARYAHLNCKNLVSFAKSNNVYGLEKLEGVIESCEACHFSKSKRESFSELENVQTSSILELLHMDLWGPSPEPSMGGARFLLSIIDDFSRFAFVYILKRKDQAFEFFKNFKQMVERQTGKKVKRIRTDNGKEFCAGYFETFLLREGIKHEKSNVYSPEMNGIAERYNRTLMEGVRSLLVQTNLPKSLWAELVYTVNYLRNRFPHKKLKGKAPLNVWRGKSFSVRHLKVIGSDAYVHIPNRYRSKLDKRSKKGILIGYAINTIGYRIWYPGTRTVVETKHVKIIEKDCSLRNVDERGQNFNDYVQFSLVNENSAMNKDESIQESPPLPKDWERVETVRKSGATAGQVDVYYFPEKNVRLRSKNEIKKYCQEKGINYNPDDFSFTPTTPNARVEETGLNVSEDEKGDEPEVHCVEVKIPCTFRESQELPEKREWNRAMKNELETLKDRKVYELVPRPEGTKVLGTRWIFTLKKDMSGSVKRFRARLVAKGFRQIEGVNYFDTFSPVISFSLVRLFYTILVVLKGWVSQHLDIKCAYLYAKLSELIFVEQPEGFVENTKEGFVWKLDKALYGLRQAGREWFLELDNTFNELGFDKIKDSNCIYVFKSEVIVLVYVDDFAVFAKNNERLNEVINLIKLKFEIKVLGKIRHFLGVDFEERNGEIFMHQQSYIEKLAEKFNIPKIKSKLPLTPGIVLNAAVEGEQAVDVPYRELVGCLLFLASHTRPDIQFSVIALAQFSNCPSLKHWKYLCQVLQYVVNTKELAINLSRISNCTLNVYTDASWASDLVDRKSISGFIVFIDNVPIIWNSCKQKCIALSSMEAEYVSLSDSIKELCWLLRIMDNFSVLLNLKIDKPNVFCDNQSAIHFSRNSIENNRTKYIDTRIYFVKDNLNKFNLKFVSGSANVADLFTKVLPSQKFLYYCKWIFG